MSDGNSDDGDDDDDDDGDDAEDNVAAFAVGGVELRDGCDISGSNLESFCPVCEEETASVLSSTGNVSSLALASRMGALRDKSHAGLSLSLVP